MAKMQSEVAIIKKITLFCRSLGDLQTCALEDRGQRAFANSPNKDNSDQTIAQRRQQLKSDN